MTNVAVMQPYFFPYEGYFRLFLASDIFVILDDVQFPRRGWVHRNRLRNRLGDLAWLTLPIEIGKRDTTKISDLVFRHDWKLVMDRQQRKFPIFESPASDVANLINEGTRFTNSVTDYLHHQLNSTCKLLQLPSAFIRSSQLAIEPDLRGWDRLAAVVNLVGGDTYVSASGGRDLYDFDYCRSNDIRVRFLAPYEGSYDSVLQRIHDVGAAKVHEEIKRNTKFA
jgi:hypothetical protein